MNNDEIHKWRHTMHIRNRLEISGHKLHDIHNDYPLAPESMKLELSKLIPNLNNFKRSCSDIPWERASQI